jgi:hypothetical protein
MKTNLNDWTCEDSITWMKGVLKAENCKELLDYELIRSHQINGRDLIDLNEENLKYDLRITNLHLRKVLLRKICELLKFINENHQNYNFFESSVEGANITQYEKFKIVNFKYNNVVKSIKCHKNTKFVEIIQEILTNHKKSEIIETICVLDNKKILIPKNCLIFDIANEGDIFELVDNSLENKNIKKIITNSNLKNSYKKSKKNKNYSFYNGQKDYNIQETASKNRLLSFDALDNFEKNGYTFSAKKNLLDSLEKEKEKVTINSYYNISNLNHYNNRKSDGSPSALITKNREKPNNKIQKKYRVNFSLSNEDEKSSHSDHPKNLIRIEDPSHCGKPNKTDFENYMNKFISSHRSFSSFNNQSYNSEKSKKLFDKKLSNYYVEAKKIKSKIF